MPMPTACRDPGEPGIPNITVNLLGDPLGTGIYTTLVGTATTRMRAACTSSPELPAGAYVVQVVTNTLPAGLVQTGDPDTFGTSLPAGTGDHHTTAPIVLAPGDVFLNADFGYWPPQRSNLGDLIFFGQREDGVFNPADGDYAIDGVTLALLDSNGVVIASTITSGGPAATNNYLFTGLPAGTYTVWVNDTAGVLAGLLPTADPDGGLDSRSTATLDGATDNRVQDHGYTPDLQEPLAGPDRRHGLPGPRQQRPAGRWRGPWRRDREAVLHQRRDSNHRDRRQWPLLFRRAPGGYCLVLVDTNTLPNGGLVYRGPGHRQPRRSPVRGDYRNGRHQPPAGLRLRASDPQRHWRHAVRTIATMTACWIRTSAAGVTVVLRDGSGNVVGTTRTDANGDYEFTGLPDGTY